MPATMTVDLENDGWLVLALRGADGTAHEVRIDLLRANAALVKLADEGEEADRAAGWAKYLTDLGIPAMSQGAAWRVAEAVVAESQKLYAGGE